jgi:hypothetical protein
VSTSISLGLEDLVECFDVVEPCCAGCFDIHVREACALLDVANRECFSMMHAFLWHHFGFEWEIDRGDGFSPHGYPEREAFKKAYFYFFWQWISGFSTIRE